VDIQKILAELHEERRQVNDAILSLERLTQGLQERKPTVTGQSGPDGGKRGGTASPAPRVKMKVKTKAAGS
jgi:hypothetical protein